MAASLPNPVVAPPHVHELLDRLHARSAEQEAKIDSTVYKTTGTSSFDDLMRDKFIALGQDKSQFVYQVARIMGATSVVEAGTSFGVSTIYLGLAVGQNVADGKAGPGKVIATEKEPEKVKLAKAHWSKRLPDAISNPLKDKNPPIAACGLKALPPGQVSGFVTGHGHIVAYFSPYLVEEEKILPWCFDC